jgi:hypothetical protein
MFNMLNTLPQLRKYSPLVCKFLDIVTGIFHVWSAPARRCSYVLEQLGLRNPAPAAIGLPIAVLSPRPALTLFREGKEIR